MQPTPFLEYNTNSHSKYYSLAERQNLYVYELIHVTHLLLRWHKRRPILIVWRTLDHILTCSYKTVSKREKCC